jgi:formylglycine-generating enzyme required for sulfatase activity
MIFQYVNRIVVIAAILLATGLVRAVEIDLVTIGNPGNAGELSGSGAGGSGIDRICGAVNYEYKIGKYEVTAGQYTEFLNAVGGVDTNNLYMFSMSQTDYGCGISQIGGGTVGNPYTYSVDPNFINRPVNYVTYWSACRFVNWLHNNQPTGLQGEGTTETGAYTLTNNGVVNNTITRNPNAKWAIASEDEWYKAAYHDKNAGLASTYFDYATCNNALPGRDLSDASGNNANLYGTPAPISSGIYTTVAGEFQNSDSSYGTYDQCGNLWECNESIISDSYRGIRGGGFGLASDTIAANDRLGPTPTLYHNELGFRVVCVPEPGSLLLIAVIAVMGLLYRCWKHA